MSFRDRIGACNNYDPARVVPLIAAGARVGLVRRDNAAVLARFADVFAVSADEVGLVATGDVATVSGAIDTVVEVLVTEGRVPKSRNETFDVSPRWGMPPVFRLDRGAVPFFGTRAYGVHLNGYLRKADGLRLRVGRRSADKQVAPNKLDNLVAGGIGSGYGINETLLKEAEEEAAIPPTLIEKAVPAGAVSYRTETRRGIRDDVLFVDDRETRPDFVPDNSGGESIY